MGTLSVEKWNQAVNQLFYLLWKSPYGQLVTRWRCGENACGSEDVYSEDTCGEHTGHASLGLKNEAKRKLKIIIFLVIAVKKWVIVI